MLAKNLAQWFRENDKIYSNNQEFLLKSIALLKAQRAYYDGEAESGGDDGGGDGGSKSDNDGDSDGGGNKSGDQSGKETKNEKKFTQDEVNAIIAKESGKYKKNRQDLLDQLTKLRDTATLTAKQKEDLENRIEQLNNETLTAKELAEQEKKKLQKSHEKEKQDLITDRDRWKNLYHEETINRNLLDAALNNNPKALNPNQVLRHLRPDAKLVEELDKDGKPTGKWTTRVTLSTANDKGEPIVLDLSATEAVKHLSEDPDFANFFISGANSGLGMFNNGNGSTLKGKRPPADPKQYSAWRKANIG